MQQSGNHQPRVAFIQNGSRLHYAVPLALQRAGMLDRVYTEWYCGERSAERWVSKLVSLVKPDLGRRMLHRRCEGLDESKVVRRSTFTLLMHQRRARRSLKGRFHLLLAGMEKFARLSTAQGFGDANVLMAFMRENHPLLFEWARARGMLTVADQIIAPATIEHAEMTEQFRRWPDWQRAEWFDYLPQVAEIERQTWAVLDHITCASDYVKQGLLREGVAEERVSVLPYPLDVQGYPFFDRRPTAAAPARPVTVGFVGHLHLRKGIPYFCEVAKRLRGRGIRFVLVGPMYIEPSVVEAHRDVVEIVGPVPRPQVLDWLRKFDVLLFPSTCEGSSSAVTEAMASGLPVVCSPNSGSVVRHGTDGFITPYDNVEAMAGYIEQLAADAQLRHDMGLSASRRAAEFTVDRYSHDIASLLSRLMAERGERADGAGAGGGAAPALRGEKPQRLAV